MIFGINTTRDISKLSQIMYMYNNFEISLVAFMPNITTNRAITYTNNMFFMGLLSLGPHAPPIRIYLTQVILFTGG